MGSSWHFGHVGNERKGIRPGNLFVIGKSSQLMMRSAAAYRELQPENVTIIGDMMETDIIGGISMGFKSVSVRSGIADEDQLNRCVYLANLLARPVKEIDFH